MFRPSSEEANFLPLVALRNLRDGAGAAAIWVKLDAIGAPITQLGRMFDLLDPERDPEVLTLLRSGSPGRMWKAHAGRAAARHDAAGVSHGLEEMLAHLPKMWRCPVTDLVTLFGYLLTHPPVNEELLLRGLRDVHTHLRARVADREVYQQLAQPLLHELLKRADDPAFRSVVLGLCEPLLDDEKSELIQEIAAYGTPGAIAVLVDHLRHRPAWHPNERILNLCGRWVDDERMADALKNHLLHLYQNHAWQAPMWLPTWFTPLYRKGLDPGLLLASHHNSPAVSHFFEELGWEEFLKLLPSLDTGSDGLLRDIQYRVLLQTKQDAMSETESEAAIAAILACRQKSQLVFIDQFRGKIAEILMQALPEDAQALLRERVS